MDCIDAILNRRSCRSFLDKKVEEDKIQKILECAIYAPSPANKQPWEFLVVTDPAYNRRLQEAAEKTKIYMAERSGWKWLPAFRIDFLTQVPVLIVVVGDPAKNGAEQFTNEPSKGYLNACSAAIQNMCLAAYSMGLGTLWYSLYEKQSVRDIFGVPEDKDPVGIVCLGYPTQTFAAPKRMGLSEKVRYISSCSEKKPSQLRGLFSYP